MTVLPLPIMTHKAALQYHTDRQAKKAANKQTANAELQYIRNWQADFQNDDFMGKPASAPPEFSVLGQSQLPRESPTSLAGASPVRRLSVTRSVTKYNSWTRASSDRPCSNLINDNRPTGMSDGSVKPLPAIPQVEETQKSKFNGKSFRSKMRRLWRSTKESSETASVNWNEFMQDPITQPPSSDTACQETYIGEIYIPPINAASALMISESRRRGGGSDSDEAEEITALPKFQASTTSASKRR